ncbi:MAG: HAD superfamily hydrolase (TIGR01509 family) [Yoonia sp.]|jgi:HAD superfamily hydrolase (TIGR01509 family)
MEFDNIDLVIFDCDGVLIDSEGISANVLIGALAKLGVIVNFDDFCQRFVGRSFPTVAKDLSVSFNLRLPDNFESEYRAELLSAFERELRPTRDILSVLGQLATPCCVATSSSPKRVIRSLEITELTGFFTGRVYTASEVSRGKPAPDLFLYAAQKMGADPARCLVIEDSLPGVEAGLAAGMQVLRYIGGEHLKDRTLKHDPAVPSFDNWQTFFQIAPALQQRR